MEEDRIEKNTQQTAVTNNILTCLEQESNPIPFDEKSVVYIVCSNVDTVNVKSEV